MTEPVPSAPRVATRPELEITVPASGRYLSVLRTAAAGLAASADFTLDDLEDLRIAVDEAASILLARAIPGSTLEVRFHRDGALVTVVARAHTLDLAPPSRDGFAWTVLTSLADDVEVSVHEPDLLVLTLRHTGTTTRKG